MYPHGIGIAKTVQRHYRPEKGEEFSHPHSKEEEGDPEEGGSKGVDVSQVSRWGAPFEIGSVSDSEYLVFVVEVKIVINEH